MKQRTPRHRITAEQVEMAEKFLEELELYCIAGGSIAEKTQRQTFRGLIPQIQDLRKKGLKWKEITSHLNECGLALKTSTIRSYFATMEAPKPLRTARKAGGMGAMAPMVTKRL